MQVKCVIYVECDGDADVAETGAMEFLGELAAEHDFEVGEVEAVEE